MKEILKWIGKNWFQCITAAAAFYGAFLSSLTCFLGEEKKPENYVLNYRQVGCGMTLKRQVSWLKSLILVSGLRPLRLPYRG